MIVLTLGIASLKLQLTFEAMVVDVGICPFWYDASV